MSIYAQLRPSFTVIVLMWIFSLSLCGPKFAALIQFADSNIGAPLSFTKNTTNFAGLVWLAFRPTT